MTLAERSSGGGVGRRDFARLLRSAREGRSLSQADVGRLLAREAQRLGIPIAPVSKVTIGRYERGQSRPSTIYALLLCRCLSMEPVELALDDLLTPERVEMVLDSLPQPPSRRVVAHRAGSAPQDESGLARPRPHQLPADLADFVGRVGELTTLASTLDPGRERRSGLPGICVLSGKPGVGKSALAVHSGHLLISRFPDAQLYADLRGADAEPQEPRTVLRWLLRSLGLAEAEIPRDLEGCAALYRSALHGRRALIVLDNARDEAQVRPLLPGSSDAAVIITSRSRLTALPGARLVELGELIAEEAMDLLERLAGDERMRREPDAAQEIMRACAGLPLALRIAGAALKGQRHWTAERLALRLADERDRLDLLRLGDLDVRASFDLSYRELRPADARVFRLLSVIPGRDWCAGLVAALIGGGLREAEDALDLLQEMQLVEVAAGGRYRLHDLLRLFSTERLGAEEPAPERGRARSRVLRWYLDSACEVAREIPVTRRSSALAWFETERANLLHAVTTARDERCWEIALGIAEAVSRFLSLRGYWSDEEVVQEVAYDCAVLLGDRLGEGHVLLNLGTVRARQGKWRDALSCLRRSRDILGPLGDRAGDGRALLGQATIYRHKGCWDDAIACFHQALAAFREAGDRHHEGDALVGLGDVHWYNCAWDDAVDCYTRALAIFRALGDGYRESQALKCLGSIHREQGRRDEARVHLEQSLAVARQLGDRLGEAQALVPLGDVHRNAGQWSEAHACYEQSLSMLRQLGIRPGVLEAWCLVQTGNLLCDQGRPTAAEERFEMGIRIFQRLGCTDAEGWAQLGLGRARLKLGDTDRAAVHIERSRSLFTEVGDRLGVAHVLPALARVHLDGNCVAEAGICCERAIALARQLRDQRGEGQALAVLGEVYAASRQWGRAADALRQSLAVLDRIAEGATAERVRRCLEDILAGEV